MTSSENTSTSVFVTVGSTKFTQLVQAILSTPVLDAISKAALERGSITTSIIVQFGSTPIRDILFSEQLGLPIANGGDEGSLPIKLLSNESGSSSTEADQTDIDRLANDLSPTAVRQQLADGTDDVTFAGLHHFSVEQKTTYGKVNLEFVDYLVDIRSYLESSDLIISHAGELIAQT